MKPELSRLSALPAARKEGTLSFGGARALVESVAKHFPGAIFRLRREPDGSLWFPFISSGAADLLERPMADLLEGDALLTRFVASEDRAKLREALKRSAAKLEPWCQEFRVAIPSGKVKWVEVRSNPWEDADEAIVWNGCLMEVTEKKEFEQKLRLAQKAAEQASLAKSAFLTMLSHETRTPLHAILSFTDLLEDSGLAGAQAEHLAMIKANGQVLLGIVEDLLSHASLEHGVLRVSPHPVDLGSILKASVHGFQSQAAAKGLAIRVEVADDFPRRVLADPTRFIQIVLNLVGNAVKFTAFGAVNVCLKVDTQDKTSVKACLMVSDTGIGIPEGKQGALFEPFSQLAGGSTRRFGGLGLGLSITKQLVDLLKGEITVESRLGHGSTFTVLLELPLCDQDKAAPPPFEPAPTPVPERRPLRILIVEDNATNRRIARALVRKLGQHEIDEVDGGLPALARADEAAYDLVLMDLEMPDLDGISATREMIRRLGDRRPVISAWTAHVMEEHRVRCREAGMDYFLGKPLRMAELQTILDAVSTTTKSPESPCLQSV